jgi:putative MATE family efflux protein
MAQAERNDARFVRMTTAPVVGLVCSLAAPSIVIMLISALYNMADTYFVGSLGTSVVAAVGIAFPLMAVIQALGFFFGQGSGNFMSRALGARETERASRMASTGFFSGIIAMVIIAAVCLVFLDPLVKVLGATPTIAPHAEEYIFFILLASPWMVAATVLNQQLRFQGSASIAMVGMVSGAVLNIVLDPLFIFVFNMGIKGAAAATMLSQIVSFIVLLAFGCTREGIIPIKVRYFSPSFPIFVEMFRGGIPALLRQSIASLSTVVVNHFSGAYGDAAIAAISIVNRIYMFAGSAMIGFGQGFQPVCGYNYGAKLYDRLKKAFWFCVRLSVAGLAVTSALLAVFAPQIIALFRRDDPEVIRIGSLGLRIYCVSLPFAAWVIMCNMMTQTIGKALYASLGAVSRQGLFLIPCLLVFNRLFGLGLLGIQISLPAAEILGFFLATPLTVIVLREMKESR